MGYYSEVGIVICCNNNSYPKLKLRLALENKEASDFLEKFEVHPGDNTVLVYRQESTKWYKEYQTPLFDWIEELEWKDEALFKEIDAGFVRVGEESGDVEARYINEGYRVILPQTSINFNI